jgi:phosphohistidine swiveling domain-containing protein
VSIEQGVALVLPLADPSATLERVGGKGASLARMAAAGLPVPPGFHITTAAYRRFVTENGLQERILAAVSAVAADQPATLEVASRQISDLFAQSAMPDEIAAAIRRAYAGLSAKAGVNDLSVAVRSSATAEDLPEMSFAGQQETYLNIRGAAQVLDAVKRCWASLWTARAIGYRARNRIAPEDVSLAVVVQELVPADAAGVLFTANPLSGTRDQVMINAAWGLGEAIVGGQVTPDTVVVDKASGTILAQRISAKDVMTVRTPDGTREEPVPADRRAHAALSPEQAAELARLGARIEALYGQPMDIEWALAGERIFVVQARPITALPDAATPGAAVGAALSQAPQAAEWPLPKPNGRYYRTSVFELLPDPLSPLFATLGLPAWSRAMTELFRGLGIGGQFPLMTLVTINGYGYYDLTLTPAQTAKLLLAMPRILTLFARLMRTTESRWQEARSRYIALVHRWEATDLAGASAADLLQAARDLTDEAALYYLTIQGGILPAAYMSEGLFTLVYNRFLRRPTDPPALTFMLGFDSAPIQAEQSLYDLARWARAQPELALPLLARSSAQFTAEYRERAIYAVAESAWREFWRRLSDHLAHFGHAIYDLDFAKGVLADDPAPVLETLKFFLSGDAPDPHERQAVAAAARERATRRMLIQLRGPRRAIFRRLVAWAQRFAPLREDALADVGLGWPVTRRMLREIGRRLVAAHALVAPDDGFYLTLDDVQEAAAALDAGQPAASYQAAVAERRATWERERALTPPAALPLKGGARFLGIDFSEMMPARIGQSAGDTLKGIAASPGRVTGVARVISGPDAFPQMRPGDILVARITTPAWTPLFALAAGVVTDVGGPLSHSSIVAREYHIPAVLGTGVATERLRSGQRITVDGDVGTVTVSNP